MIVASELEKERDKHLWSESRLLDRPIYQGDPTRLLSEDPFAVLSWHGKAEAIGGGYWWPERLTLPEHVKADSSLKVPFVPYEPVGARLMPRYLAGSERAVTARRRVPNRPVVAGPGSWEAMGVMCFAEMPKEWGFGLEPYVRLHPERDEPTWAWRRSDRLRVCLWLLPGRKEEFMADVAAERLKNS
jgi:hypothetical protein